MVLAIEVVDVDVLEAAGAKRLADDPEWQFVKLVSVVAYSDGDALLVLLAAFELSSGKQIVGLHTVESLVSSMLYMLASAYWSRIVRMCGKDSSMISVSTTPLSPNRRCDRI